MIIYLVLIQLSYRLVGKRFYRAHTLRFNEPLLLTRKYLFSDTVPTWLTYVRPIFIDCEAAHLRWPMSAVLVHPFTQGWLLSHLVRFASGRYLDAGVSVAGRSGHSRVRRFGAIFTFLHNVAKICFACGGQWQFTIAQKWENGF